MRIDLILSIPLHTKRLKERGYNQSILIAKALESYTGISCEFGCLERVRWTVPQVELKRSLREKNVRGAFRVSRPEMIKGKKVLLVDDVLTTGATVNEATKALMNSGTKEVHVLTLGRVVRF
jgi:ComF family protein